MNEADPRVKRTRKLLQEAFMELLAEKSFHAISVQDIAERATLNRATFYAHFEDKYALMDYMVGDLFREALQRRLASAAPFTLSNLHVLVVTVCEFLTQFNGHCAPADRDLDPRIEAKVQQELHAFLLHWLSQASPDGTSTASHRASREAAASMMSWAIFGTSIEWSRSDHRRSVDEWARQIVLVLLEGVAQLIHIDVQSPRAARL
ncbi:MAG: TetR family transcriptional regulator [Ktedonobacterales bacterium]